MYDYVSPQKVLNALRWLRFHNPLYSDIDIDDEWVLNAETDDSDLFSSLINQPMPDLEVPIVQITIPTDVSTHEDNPEMPMDVDTGRVCS